MAKSNVRLDKLVSSLIEGGATRQSVGNRVSNLQNASRTGSSAKGISFAKGVPEEALSPERRQQKQARELLGIKGTSIEDAKDLAVEDLRILAQDGPAKPEETSGGLLGLGEQTLNRSPLVQAGKFGLEFLQSLTQPKQESAQASSGQVDPRVREIEDNAAIAIAEGRDPVAVNQRKVKLIKELGL